MYKQGEVLPEGDDDDEDGKKVRADHMGAVKATKPQ
jgi:hypothetical protein